MKRKQAFYHIGSPDEGVVNLTPLIDVVFVVLIMFILVAPMLDLERIHLANASSDEKKQTHSIQENAPIKIHVYSDNTIWINNHLVKEKDLLPLLKNIQALYPGSIPQLYHDKNAFFGTYQNVKNAIEASGFQQMDVILKPS